MAKIDKTHVAEGILIRVVATVVATILLVFLFQWMGLATLPAVAYRKLSKGK